MRRVYPCDSIEITESALIDHPVRALQNLERLDKLGVSIATDNFGTGYSSLSCLKKLPLDTLKIDRNVVSEMLTSESDSVIVDSAIDLAHNFSFTVIAESGGSGNTGRTGSKQV